MDQLNSFGDFDKFFPVIILVENISTENFRLLMIINNFIYSYKSRIIMFYDYRKMPGHQSNPNITKDTKCWGIIVSYESYDGQSLDGKEDWLEPFQNLTFEEAEQLNKQLKDNV